MAGKPQRLAENGKKSFQGSIVLGMGFVLTPEEAAALIAKDPRNRETLVFPLNIPAVSRRLEETPYPYPRRLTAGRS